MTEIVEGEAVEITRDLELRPTGSVTLFGTDDPAEVIAKATRMADALMNVVRSKGLAKRIGPKDYLLVEAWTCLGSLVGVYARTVWTKKIVSDLEDVGWEARVEVVTRTGDVISAAEAECLRLEKNWMNRDDYALRSMAQTRAMGKALRMPLGFIAVLAGFEATPAEEMPVEEKPKPKSRAPKAKDDKPVPSDPGDVELPGGPYAGQTIHDAWMQDPGHVEAVAKGAKNPVVKVAAEMFLELKRSEPLPDNLPFS